DDSSQSSKLDNNLNNNIKKLESSLSILGWDFYNEDDFSFFHPSDWELNDLENKIVISKENIIIELEIKENKLELDLVDWLITQKDYPDFNKEFIYVNDIEAMMVSSADSDWKADTTIFLPNQNQVYIFKYLDESSKHLDIYQALILSFDFHK
ncbi:hypothetical protein K8R66_00515, partial [bacterium]|nr:hypothetical protein [bacterium]